MRSKSKKITLGLCLIVLTACLLCGCSGNPKNFTVDTMTITLTDNFKESKMSGFDAYFVSDDVSFSVKMILLNKSPVDKAIIFSKICSPVPLIIINVSCSLILFKSFIVALLA